jgi:hypothetical protein
MKKVKFAIYQLIVFMCGFVVCMNAYTLIPHSNYDASWFKLLLALMFGIYFSYDSYESIIKRNN